MLSAVPPNPSDRPEQQAGGGVLRRIAKALLWPVRRVLDPRFGGMAAQIEAESRVTREHLGALGHDHLTAVLRAQEELKQHLLAQLDDLQKLAVAEMEAAAEASTLVGEAIAGFSADLAAVSEDAEMASGRYFEQLIGEGVEALDARAAAFLNHADSHDGFAAQRNLWFNWPLTIAYEEGDVHLGGVNERIVEIAYALRAVSQLEPGSRILDVGATENTLALSLASLGFSVTALDPRRYPLEHPNLAVAVGTVESWSSNEPFDAALCISTLEHIGSGEYGQAEDPDADAKALAQLHALLREGGLLVLTTPYGKATAGEGARAYDRRRLDELLGDWNVEDFTVIERRDATTWAPSDKPRGEAVALVTARR
jgi:SAM-dependent methyltransferase